MEWGIWNACFFLHYLACWRTLFRATSYKTQRNCILEAALWACLMCQGLVFKGTRRGGRGYFLPPHLSELFPGTYSGFAGEHTAVPVLTVMWNIPFLKLHSASCLLEHCSDCSASARCPRGTPRHVGTPGSCARAGELGSALLHSSSCAKCWKTCPGVKCCLQDMHICHLQREI